MSEKIKKIKKSIDKGYEFRYIASHRLQKEKVLKKRLLLEKVDRGKEQMHGWRLPEEVTAEVH